MRVVGYGRGYAGGMFGGAIHPEMGGSILGHPPGEFRHLRGPAGALCLGKRQPQTYPIHFARFRARVSLDAT